MQTAGGKTKTVNVPALPAAQEIAGPWQVPSTPKPEGRATSRLPSLEDWSQRAEAGIKYYSGTAVYQTTLSPTAVSANTKWMLDLGKVEVMAEVKLNGKDLGILWKPPYQVDVSSALQPGENQLELKVVNLWINRQIGDENLPEDSERNTGTAHSSHGRSGCSRESPARPGASAFTSWRLWKKGDPLSSFRLDRPGAPVSRGAAASAVSHD